MLIDVTETVQAKKDLERMNQDLTDALNKAKIATQMKSEFLATVSHEIRYVDGRGKSTGLTSKEPL